ncbi:MAG: hypothetical protein HUJ26_03455 [Planctomycetaceae bacterium]|nr:hypothetical protein [Planctomycetaceae bacterium]
MHQRLSKTRAEPATTTRRAFTTVELIVSMTLLALLFSTIVPMLRWADYQKKVSQRRTIATQVASNLLEELTSQKYAGLTTAIAEQSEVPAEYQKVLPDAQLDVDLAPPEAPLAGQKITVTLRWRDRTGQTARPVRLTTFIYPQTGGSL